MYIMCEHTLTNTESENSVSLSDQILAWSLSQATTITTTKQFTKMVQSVVSHINGCDLLPQEGVNPKDNYPMILLW